MQTTVLLLVGLFLAGCATAKSRDASPPTAAPQPAEFLKPASLYLLSSPHRQIYVEIDAVEGCEPTETALLQLQAFLTKFCQKPDGVEIMVSDIIPRQAARKTSPQALARRYLNGPPADAASPPAFMYVLYYPGKFGITPPYAQTYPYPVIYFNTHFSFGIALNEILLHEAGHLLGLVHRTEHAGNGHCRNSGCQMNNHLGYLRQFRWLPWRKQSPLCAECIAELARAGKQPPLTNWRYVGPVLVRSEPDYDVLTLPERVLITIGGATEADCQQFTESIHSDAKSPSNWYRVDCRAKEEAFDDPVKLCRLMDSFKADSFAAVRDLGPRVLVGAALHRYDTTQQYSNAVTLLNKAIQLSRDEAWNYNRLAWIKATCPDATLRNGPEAITGATKACELTKWQEWGTIDTLAAAHAEANDFQRAIELQQQALRTGKPGKADQASMHERLSLYEQSKPFREKPATP